MVTGVQTFLLGIPWMDPHWLLQHFHTEFIWLSLVIVLIECGLFFPFLPGDTLLFSVGLFVATNELNLVGGPNLLGLLVACVAFLVAAFLGNVAGYEIGRAIGPPVRRHDGRIIKKKYLDQTVDFFERHGSQALVILGSRGGRLHVLGQRGYDDPRTVERFDGLPLAERTPGTHVLNTGVPAFFESKEQLERLYPGRYDTLDGFAAWAYLPLIASGRPVCQLARSPFAATW